MGIPFLGCAPMPSPLLSRPHTNALLTSLHLYSSAAVHDNFSAEPVPMPTHHHPHSHPSFELIGGARDLFLPVLGNLARPYYPFPLVGLNRHVETIFAAFFRSVPGVKFRRECLRTKDDGAVALDWVSGDDRLLPADSPVLILLPGLTGGSEDAYVRHMLIRARNKGWRVVVFNSRGCGDSPVTTPQNPPAMQSTRTRYSLLYLILQFHSPGQTVMVQHDLHLIFYSASFLGDMHEVVSHVTTRYPEANIYAVGWSLGANILVRYLGQESHACPLSGAVSLCNPFNLVLADEDFHKGFNIVYNKALAKALSRIFKKHALLFEDMGGEYNIQLAVNAKSVREFDDGLTRVSFGFKSVDEYYSNSSSSDSIKHVQIPLLCIQAANDPIAPSRGIPREDIKENPNCLLIVTPKGGHLGWVAGDEAPLGSPWTDPLVIDFLQHLERGAIKSGTACSDPEGDHRSERALHNLEA